MSGLRLRGGYTGVELLVVLSLVITLASIALPGVLISLRKGRVNSAANAVLVVAAEARARAMTDATVTGKAYGLVLLTEPDGASVALTYGPSASADHILRRDDDGQPVMLRRLNANVEIVIGRGGASPQPARGEIGWLYQRRTGFPVATADANAPVITVGLPESPDITALELWSRDGHMSSDLAIYSIGLGHASKVE